MLLYRDKSLWEQRLQIADESLASVILLDPGGHVRWITSGPFTDTLLLACLELGELALEVFESLSRLCELPVRSEALVVDQVLSRGRD